MLKLWFLLISFLHKSLFIIAYLKKTFTSLKTHK